MANNKMLLAKYPFAALLSFLNSSNNPTITDPNPPKKVINDIIKKNPFPGNVSVAKANPTIATIANAILIKNIFFCSPMVGYYQKYFMQLFLVL